MASAIHRYHDGTKHHVGRFARSLGYLDWASQPRPFRSFAPARCVLLYPHPEAPCRGPAPPRVPWLDPVAPRPPAPLDAVLVGDLLRHALGLSAWKVAGASRWSLRVNPSSGNLHPTEAYVVCPPVDALTANPAVFHYAPDAHVLEQRCAIDPDGWRDASGGGDVVLVALTSIHWRESWKYGERAFRYCQHDLGHAIAAIAIAARLHGWIARLLPGWSSADVAAMCGIDRDEDFHEAEREEPGGVLALTPAGTMPAAALDTGSALARLAAGGTWTGRASRLSDDHVEWTFIDEVAAATRTPGIERQMVPGGAPVEKRVEPAPPPAADARTLILQRRSAVAFDGRTAIDAEAFFRILRGTLPGDRAPWDALWWPPAIHLLLFVHRVTGINPGLYLFGRRAGIEADIRSAVGREWAWEPVAGGLSLFLLGRGDCRAMARGLSCAQDIAADGCFSLGMLAEFDASLTAYGDAFYRQLFWESGCVGQQLYLEAEAAGLRGTGIGCFFDDDVHDVLGLSGHRFQSLYHFTIGGAVEDRRITTERGYEWEER